MARQPLGQHFLIRRSVVGRILQTLQLSEKDHLLEIGPGKGALTRPLVERAKQVLLVEKDPALAQEVGGYLGDSAQLIQGDFLKIPWEQITAELGETFKTVSNLPYQSATAIFLKLLNFLPPNALMVLMFQKEVAERLTALPRCKDYGSLTVFTQVLARVKKVFEVEPQAFRPPPRVWSTVLRVQLRAQPLVPKIQLTEFEKILRAGFAHRRKMLRQNLKIFLGDQGAPGVEKLLEKVGASPQARAEELSVEQWVDLFCEGWKGKVSEE